LLQLSLNLAELHALLDTIDPTGGTSESPVNGVIFSTALNVMGNLTWAGQHCLQNIILKPLHAHLSSYAAVSIWSSVDPDRESVKKVV
jgi:hypothetical protein